jgi:uncharacterized membrane protein
VSEGRSITATGIRRLCCPNHWIGWSFGISLGVPTVATKENSAVIWMYLVALVSFLAIDAVVLKFFMLPLFSRHIGEMLREQTQLGVAFGFYVIFVAGLLYLAVLPALSEQNLWRAVKNGAVIGFISYGTYEATNMATLRGWAWPMLAADITWGTILCATVAAIAYGVGKSVA